VLEFRILGPLEIRTGDRRHVLKGVMQNTLLTTLLTSEDHCVPLQGLVNELWGQARPVNADNALHAHVSRLRRSMELIEPDHPGRLAASRSHYRLVIEPDDHTDVGEFSRAVAAAFQTAERAPVCAARLRAALALWRGHTLGGVTGGPLCQYAAARLESLRLRAYEALFDAELERGRHAEIISELRELISHDSGHLEHFCEQLLIALYRSGRQADALELYRVTWNRMVKDVGITPSPNMRRYESAILRHDPVLSSPHARRALAA
jgi:SARP family transcriptional regulator, regulator of embCAB operon